MDIDPVIAGVVSDVVSSARQPSEVADQLKLWYDQVISGNESLVIGPVANKHAAFSHLDLIFDHMWSPKKETP